MEGMATNFFKELYKADPRVQAEEVATNFNPAISDTTNVDLIKNFSIEEISDALFQIGPLKAPGPDGFLLIFSRGTGVR
jgi:hypothetical protein